MKVHHDLTRLDLQRKNASMSTTQPVDRSQNSSAVPAEKRRVYAQDFVWEFGWSPDDLERLMPYSQPCADCAVSPVDRALALAG